MLAIFDDKEQLIECLQLKGEKQQELFEKAKNIRNSMCQNKVYVRGVLEISDYCCCNCKFCGNAAYVKKKTRYRMSLKEIKTQINLAKKIGLDVVHIASGEDKGFDFDILVNSVKYILDNGMYPELAVGKLKPKQYEELYRIGARRVILKFETSDKNLFGEVKTCNSSFGELWLMIQELIERGFHVGSGNIIGLPGQSIDSVADDLLLLKKLKVRMASTSVFMPNAESLFSKEDKGDPNIALNFIALLRCLKPFDSISIPANSTFGIEGKKAALQFASNELSLNITPEKYQNIYSIYEGANRAKSNLDTIKKTICDAKCELSTMKSVIYG